MDETQKDHQIPTVELGGRLWELRFGHKAMRMFCRLTKCTLSGFDQALDSYDNQFVLLWCILQTQDPAVKRDDLENWLDELLLEDVFTIIQDAIAAAMPSTAGKRIAEMRARDTTAGETDGDEANPTTGSTNISETA